MGYRDEFDLERIVAEHGNTQGNVQRLRQISHRGGLSIGNCAD